MLGPSSAVRRSIEAAPGDLRAAKFESVSCLLGIRWTGAILSLVPDITPAGTAKAESDLAVVSDRLARAESSEDVILWTRVRGEMMRQNDDAEANRHRRSLEKWTIFLKPGMSFAGLIAGTGLVLAGHQLPGFFAIGAALFWIAPEFTKRFFEKALPRAGSDNE